MHCASLWRLWKHEKPLSERFISPSATAKFSSVVNHHFLTFFHEDFVTFLVRHKSDSFHILIIHPFHWGAAKLDFHCLECLLKVIHISVSPPPPQVKKTLSFDHTDNPAHIQKVKSEFYIRTQRMDGYPFIQNKQEASFVLIVFWQSCPQVEYV